LRKILIGNDVSFEIDSRPGRKPVAVPRQVEEVTTLRRISIESLFNSAPASTDDPIAMSEVSIQTDNLFNSSEVAVQTSEKSSVSEIGVQTEDPAFVCETDNLSYLSEVAGLTDQTDHLIPSTKSDEIPEIPRGGRRASWATPESPAQPCKWAELDESDDDESIITVNITGSFETRDDTTRPGHRYIPSKISNPSRMMARRIKKRIKPSCNSYFRLVCGINGRSSFSRKNFQLERNRK
jgi:hypothetical protein